MKIITKKNINDELYLSKYEWQNKSTIKKMWKSDIEVNNYEYVVKAFFRDKHYGYDVWIIDELNRNEYYLNEFKTIKTKKEIIKEVYNFFNDIEEEEEEGK